MAVLAGETETARLAGGRIELCCAGDAEQAAALYRRWFTEESGRLLGTDAAGSVSALRRGRVAFSAAPAEVSPLPLGQLHGRHGADQPQPPPLPASGGVDPAGHLP